MSTARTRPATTPAGSAPVAAEPVRMTLRAGWDAAVRHLVAPPDLADCAPAGTPISDDDPRMLYHGSLGPVTTPDINHGLKAARRALRTNRQTVQTPVHLAVDGERGTGKTTLLHLIGRAYQGRLEQRHGTHPGPHPEAHAGERHGTGATTDSSTDSNRIPVVCINTPPTRDDTVNWAAQIAVFLGWDLYRRDPDGTTAPRMRDWTGPVVHVLRAAHTRLLLVDGVDRLHHTDIPPTFGFFDFLAAEIGLTVIWCGTGAREILREARGEPDHGAWLPRKKAPTLWVRPIPYTPAHPEPWVRTLDGFDSLLRLHHHTRHDLLAHAELLHKVSEGRMDVLAPLICQAAQIALETAHTTGTEAITTSILDEATALLR